MKSNRHRKGKTILKQKNKVGYYYYLILRLTLKLQQVIIIGHWCYRHRGQQTRIGFRNRSRHKWPNDFFFYGIYFLLEKKRHLWNFRFVRQFIWQCNFCFDKDDIVIQRERIFFSTNRAEEIGLPCDRKKRI